MNNLNSIFRCGLIFSIFITLVVNSVESQWLLVPMDTVQKNHLKAYGLTYWTLETPRNYTAKWLLNFRGGAFLLQSSSDVVQRSKEMGISVEQISDQDYVAIQQEMDLANMDEILLEKAPKIAVYRPPDDSPYRDPWDDAVKIALEYAEIPFQSIWDEELISGTFFTSKYDWLHLHHEDFTGQYGKFYRNYHTADWYIDQQKQFESMAIKLGFNSVHNQKKALAQIIKNYIANGGFLFAMCSATDSFDIALSVINVDAVHSVFDGSGIDNNLNNKIDYNNSLAFTNFEIITDPMVYEYSDIDYPQSNNVVVRGAEADYFSLFEFSAKYDPVPTMLTQNHVPVIKGFMGQTTGFNRERIKKHVLIMGEDRTTPQVKYIHGNHGQGTFTFLGGHDPEDYQHFVGDPQTDLSLHQNSPGYRLILNNILFPAARKKERKT